MADLAASVPQPASGLPHTGSLLKLGQAFCDCGAPDAPHRGELRTTRVAPGVVRDERVWRCADCHRRHVAELAAAQRALMPPAIWLAGVAGPARHDIVVRWGWDPEWLAPLPCGVRWDALALGGGLGLAALEALCVGDTRTRLGPVLHDQGAALTFWLLPVEADAADWWRMIAPAAELLSKGDHLLAPDPEPEPSNLSAVRWIHRPTVTGTLTPPSLLAAAVRELNAEDGR